MNTPHDRPPSLHRRAAAFGLAAALTSTFGQSIFIGLFGAQIQAELGLSPSTWGALYGLATGISGMTMFWLGALADRVAAARAITLALLILAAGAATMAVAQAPWMLALAFFCLRLGGQGLCSHIAIVTAARHARLRGRNIAIAAFGFILGEATMPLLITALLGWTDWRWVWAGAGVVLLLGALPLLRRVAAPLPLATPPAATGTAAAATTMRRRDLLRHPAFLAALPVALVFPFVVTSVFLHQGSISALRAWSPQQVAIAYLCFAGSQAVTTWLAGRLVDHSGAVQMFRFYLLPLAAGVLIGAYAPPHLAVWGLYIGLGMGSGCQSVMSGALWAELFGIERLGLVRGVFTALMVLATAASPPLLGLALQNQIPLTLLAGVVAAYAVVMPQIAVRWLRKAPAAQMADG
ncbi:MAG: MFS transporter [Burkholderiaceae bacterium]|nr:MFS transporter [Rhodoferax sp.]MCB2028718.1 MFS transporter [Rhodoferax sp.]MCP5261591.1 MFS transporter [Rhodoferax sp.]